ncbi:unnamed protein product [Meloidogyne enterolobii]|uniref:Uncharacterized protein n=1 Tax=Meloidogyne enterolobii TaxID=390850 RepID=A0ACB1AAD6_MELEN
MNNLINILSVSFALFVIYQALNAQRLDCAVVTERNGCQLCACPIGSPARGCDPMPFVLWHDLIVNGCPNVTVNTRDPAQKVHRWFRRV